MRKAIQKEKTQIIIASPDADSTAFGLAIKQDMCKIGVVYLSRTCCAHARGAHPMRV